MFGVSQTDFCCHLTSIQGSVSVLKYKSVTEQLVKPWVNLEFGGYVW